MHVCRASRSPWQWLLGTSLAGPASWHIALEHTLPTVSHRGCQCQLHPEILTLICSLGLKRPPDLQIPLPPIDEKKKVTEDVEKDRRYSIDAAIVRTMKSRKQSTHQALVIEVSQD